MSDHSKLLGIRIRNLRKKKQITQDELANKLGIKRATLSKYETGTIEPSLDMLIKLSDSLKVPLSVILPLEEFDFSGPGYVPDLFSPFDDEEKNFLFYRIKEFLAMLNIDGMKTAKERIEELTELPRYQKAPLQDKAQSGEASKEGEGS